VVLVVFPGRQPCHARPTIASDAKFWVDVGLHAGLHAGGLDSITPTAKLAVEMLGTVAGDVGVKASLRAKQHANAAKNWASNFPSFAICLTDWAALRGFLVKRFSTRKVAAF